MYFFAFLLYPLIEIFVFIEVVRASSWQSAIFLTLATTFFGFALLRLQRNGRLFGVSDFSRRSVENYLFANLGAVALILPGFVSDAFGLLILIPITRRLLLAFFRWIHFDLYRSANGAFSVFRTYSFDPRHASQAPNGADDSDQPIDVESFCFDDDENSIQRFEENDDEPIDVEFVVRD